MAEVVAVKSYFNYEQLTFSSKYTKTVLQQLLGATMPWLATKCSISPPIQVLWDKK